MPVPARSSYGAVVRSGLAERGFTDIDVAEVPGAFEIPARRVRRSTVHPCRMIAER